MQKVIVFDADELRGRNDADAISLLAIDDLEFVVDLHDAVAGDDELTVALFGCERPDAGTDLDAIRNRRRDVDAEVEGILAVQTKGLRRADAAACIPILEHAHLFFGAISEHPKRCVETAICVRVARLNRERKIAARPFASFHELERRAVFCFVVLQLKRDELRAAIRKARREIGGIDSSFFDFFSNDRIRDRHR